MNLGAKTVVGAVLGAALAGAAAQASMDWQSARAFSRRDGERARSVIASWPESARLVAARMLESYGTPDEVRRDALTWRGKAPWDRTTVRRAPPDGEAGAEGVLEQAVRRDVPPELREDLSRFGRGASYDAAAGELRARSGSEERNFLALNLAVEIISGWRGPADARDFYDRTVALSLEGKSSTYMRGFLFSPAPKAGPVTRP